MIDIKKSIAAAENQLDIIISVHKKNLSNYCAAPDELDDLYETALMSLVLLKQLEKHIILNNLNSKNFI